MTKGNPSFETFKASQDRTNTLAYLIHFRWSRPQMIAKAENTH
jgi:hypothetical protein